MNATLESLRAFPHKLASGTNDCDCSICMEEQLCRLLCGWCLVSPFHDSIQSGLFSKFSSLALKPFQCQPCNFCSGQLYWHLWAGSSPGTEDKPQVSLQALPVVLSPFWAWGVGADNFVSKLACSQEYVLFAGWVQIIAFALLLSRRHLYSLTCQSGIVFVME